MMPLLPRIVLIVMIGLGFAAELIADDCADGRQMVAQNLAKPPEAGTEKAFKEALKKCPADSNLFHQIGDYYVHWSKNDINPEHQAFFNYLATEYYAQGIKTGEGPDIESMKAKLADIESGVEDISAVGIRGIKPFARLNIRVYYEFNSSGLTSDAQAQLDVLGKYLSESGSAPIILEGHTDMSGEQEYNIMLSIQRAESAKDYLVRNFGIAPEIIQTQGYGFERLADVVDPYSGKNRRVRVRKLAN